jgi:hypothetical protein
VSANRLATRAGFAIWIGSAIAALATGTPLLFWGCLLGIALIALAEFG